MPNVTTNERSKNMKSITIKKLVTKFDTNVIHLDVPYRINLNGNTYVGVFCMIDEDRLEFKYFNEDGNIEFEIIRPTVDVEIFPFRSLLPELKKNEISVVHNEDVPVEPEKPVEKDEPDIRSFYIRDMRTHNKYPLFVKDNGALVINYDFLEKLLYDDSILFSISFGIKGHHSCASHIFKSKDVRIHVGGTTLTGKILNEYRDVITCVEIRAGDWKQLEYAHVVIKNRKDVTNDSSDK